MKNTNKILILLFLVILLCAGKTGAQELDDIVTDRPDQTESAITVPKGTVQFELGASIEKSYEYIPGVTTTETVTAHTHSYPALLIRYGILKNIELRLAMEYLQLKESSEFDSNLQGEKGFGPLTLGTKIQLFTEKNGRPDAAFIFHLNIPFKKNDPFQPEYIGTDFRVAVAHTLSDRFSLSYNLGGEWNGNTPQATGIYTLALGISLLNKLSMYVESYGFLPQGEVPDHRLDGGFTYLFAKNIQADVSGGIGISDISPDYYVALGFSVRLPR